jgi:hypothetical protein
MGDKVENRSSTLWQLPKDVCCSYDINFILTVTKCLEETTNCTKLTNFMQQNPSWETTSHLATHEFPNILCNPKVHYHVHMSPPLVPNLPLLPDLIILISAKSTSCEAPHYATALKSKNLVSPKRRTLEEIKRTTKACQFHTWNIVKDLTMICRWTILMKWNNWPIVILGGGGEINKI